MMTMATPLSAVSTTIDVSCSSSVNVLHSCMVRLVLWVVVVVVVAKYEANV